MNDQEKLIEDLRQAVSKLHALLDDPQPGISAWWLAVTKQLGTVAAFYPKEPKI